MKTQWKWAIGIFLFCLLAPIIATVISLGVRFHAIDEGSVVASGFLNALRNHDYTTAHTLMAPSEQAAISVTAIQRAQEQIEKKHGSWLSPAMKLEHHPNEALDHITYFYEVEARDGSGMPIMVRVIRTDSGWRVLEYQYDDSPA